ncbi:reverse transcriptase domain, reverse transcriptase zinc-binding domain protein [Tanacetum coccineum]
MCFWDDVWCGETSLSHSFPRLYALEEDKGISVASKMAHVNLSSSFRRSPRGGAEHSQMEDLLVRLERVELGVSQEDGGVLYGSVSSVFPSIRKALDDIRLPNVSTQTRWIKEVPIKINVHAWKLHLHANVARFDRNVEVKSNPIRAKSVSPVVNNDRNAPHSTKDTSYVNISKASLNSSGKATNKDQEESRDFRSIVNTRNMYRSEGLLEVDFIYLGGLWVLFDFTSLDARDKFLNHKGVMTWFSTLKPWYDDFVVEERLIWVEIEGVPIRAWNNDTFKEICSRWGEVLFMDDSDEYNRLSKRLCIKSSHALSVFTTILVTLNTVTYVIRVRELCS